MTGAKRARAKTEGDGGVLKYGKRVVIASSAVGAILILMLVVAMTVSSRDLLRTAKLPLLSGASEPHASDTLRAGIDRYGCVGVGNRGSSDAASHMATEEGKAQGEEEERKGDAEIRLRDDDSVRLITEGNDALVYFAGPDVLIATMGKGGSSSVYKTMFAGLMGELWTSKWSHSQDLSDPHWRSEGSLLFNLPLSRQREILSSTSSPAVPGSKPNSSTAAPSAGGPGSGTLRIAVQRDPYERLISAYKAKVTCEIERFKGGKKNRDYIVPVLRRQANMPPSPITCMNMSEFATVLDRIRLYAGTPGFISSIASLDKHFRPQDFFFDLVDYHLILDINDWSDLNILRPLLDRLPHADFLRASSDVTHSNTASDATLYIPEHAATSLHRFATLSKLAHPKYIVP